MEKIFVGKIMKNRLSNGTEIIVRIMALNVANTAMARVCDNRESLPDAYLISKNRTWAAPIENLIEDSETKALNEKAFSIIGHKDALIHYNFD